MMSDRMETPATLNDPGTWPPQRQRLVWALAILVVGALAWTFWLENEQARWAAERAREAALRDAHTAMVQRVKGLKALQARKAQLEEELGRLEKQLPAATEMEGLLRGITAAGRVRGLQFELFRPAPVQIRDSHAEIPVAVRVVGGYHDIGAFLGDLARLPRIVTLHNMVLTPQAQLVTGDRPVPVGSRLLVMEATLRTYRALDAQELAQSRRRSDRSSAAGGVAAPNAAAANSNAPSVGVPGGAR